MRNVLGQSWPCVCDVCLVEFESASPKGRYCCEAHKAAAHRPNRCACGAAIRAESTSCRPCSARAMTPLAHTAAVRAARAETLRENTWPAVCWTCRGEYEAGHPRNNGPQYCKPACRALAYRARKKERTLTCV